jgi:preprotein translocase subunit YajC
MLYILLEAGTQAAGTTGGKTANPGSPYSSLIFFAVIFGVMYFLMIRPQQKRAKETQRMLASLQQNDKVITNTGIYGRVISIKPDKDIVVVEIDETNHVKVEMQRSAIAAILNLRENVDTTVK